MASSATSKPDTASSSQQPSLAHKYRGATVEDLDPPSALSTSPKSPIAHALMAAFERDYTHLTVVRPEDRSLVGYVSIPRLRALLETRAVHDSAPVEAAMTRFQRKGRRYRLITMETPLEELDRFFRGEEEERVEGGGASGSGTTTATGQPQDFAVVTDPSRRFVLGVATRDDLQRFVERRPT